jgi:hypothetical protein
MIVAKFKEHFPADSVTRLRESEFMGLCASVQSGGDPRVLHLHPTPHEYRALKSQLKELESEGALTFVEAAG